MYGKKKNDPRKFGASQLGIRAYVHEYLGLEGIGLRPWSLRYKSITDWYSLVSELGLELPSAQEIDVQIIVGYQGLGRRLPRSPRDRIRSQHAFCISCVSFDYMCVIGVTNWVNYICDKCMWKTRSTWGLEDIMNMEFNNSFSI